MSALTPYASHVASDLFLFYVPGAIILPRIRRRKPQPLVMYAHGAGSDASEATGPTSTHAIPPLLRAIVGAGFPVAASTQTQTWGNVTSSDRIFYAEFLMKEPEFYMTGGLSYVSPDPIVIVGASHGACSAVSYAMEVGIDIAGIVAILPALDLEAIRSGNIMGFRAVIDSAWGVQYPAPLPAGANTINLNPGIPVQVWAASDDPISVGAEAWTATVGGEYHDLGALGHTNDAIAAVDTEAVVDFIQSLYA